MEAAARVAVLVCLLAALPSLARAQACGPVDPEDIGDATLPTGYGGTTWGMNGEAVQAVRGHALEKQADLQNPDVYYLFEPIEDDPSAIRVRYTFYKDRLMEVLQHLDERYLEIPESSLVGRFYEEFGDHQYHQLLPPPRDTSEPTTDGGKVDKTWTWCDRFTEQTLVRAVWDGEIRVRRTSRVVHAELEESVLGTQDSDIVRSLEELKLR